MRIVKLSSEVTNFGTLEACKLYFKNVLPWANHYFPIVGSANKIAADKTYIDEIALFVYSGNIVAIGKIAKYELDEKNRVAGFQLREDSFKVFDNTYDLVKLERKMTSNGYNVSINRGPGWNEIPQEYERVVINYLVENEWKSYL